MKKAINNVFNNLKTKEIHLDNKVWIILMVAAISFYFIQSSLAIFESTIDKKGIVSLNTTDNFFTIASSKGTVSGKTLTVTVEPSTNEKIELTITSIAASSTKYKVYYTTVLPNGVTTGMSDSTQDQYTDIIEQSNTKTINVVVKNTTSNPITVEFGVQGGYKDNEVALSNDKFPLSGIISLGPLSSITIIPPNSLDRIIKANVNCTGGSGTWYSLNTRLELGDLTENVNCTITNNSASSTLLSNHIKSLVNTTQGDGKLVLENGHRYEGVNPNNYIRFNNEMWRIIGVFDTVLDDGTTTESLVKIIKEKPLQALAWDGGNTNDWSTSDAKEILNNYYYNSTNGTESGHCYQYSTSIKGICDYTNTGINEKYRDLIEEVTWNLGGSNTNKLTTHEFYEAERGTTVYSGNPTTDTGYIGLMYSSDYGYGALSSNCSRSTKLSSYNNSNCAGKNWLGGNGYSWTITPHASYLSRVFYVTVFGYVVSSNAYRGYGLSPVLYLKSSATLLGGEGTYSEPYELG